MENKDTVNPIENDEKKRKSDARFEIKHWFIGLILIIVSFALILKNNNPFTFIMAMGLVFYYLYYVGKKKSL